MATLARDAIVMKDSLIHTGMEAIAKNWVSGGIGNDWALGTPSKAFITSAGSGTKCWVTGFWIGQCGEIDDV